MSESKNNPYSTIHRDGHGNIIGSERQVEGYGSDIHDAGGNRVGGSTTFGTFDNAMNRKSDGDDPGLLWNEK